MLALASFGVLAAFLLAIELTRETRGRAGVSGGRRCCASRPCSYAQSMLAQLDAPAMLFTTLALLLFVQDHVRAAAAACVALVLVKETGAVVPVVLGSGWRANGAGGTPPGSLAPLAALGAWIAILARQTGSLGGQRGFRALQRALSAAPGAAAGHARRGGCIYPDVRELPLGGHGRGAFMPGGKSRIFRSRGPGGSRRR